MVVFLIPHTFSVPLSNAFILSGCISPRVTLVGDVEGNEK